jgi:hypothetical protein
MQSERHDVDACLPEWTLWGIRCNEYTVRKSDNYWKWYSVFGAERFAHSLSERDREQYCEAHSLSDRDREQYCDTDLVHRCSCNVARYIHDRNCIRIGDNIKLFLVKRFEQYLLEGIVRGRDPGAHCDGDIDSNRASNSKQHAAAGLCL